MKIYLCDLVHDIGQRTRVIPLGIGTIACAVKDSYNDQISTKLFIEAKKIIEKLKSDPPDVLAFSNYIWNTRLSLKIAKLAKEIKPNILTVMGGPHARPDQEGLKNFLDKNKQIDAYIPFEGEAPFAALMGECLKKKTFDIKKIGFVQGSFLNLENYKFERLMVKNDDTSKKEKYNSAYYTINRYSSPYLNGDLDEFLDDPSLSPMLESNRGCPYSCTFCAWGIGSGNKLIKKNLDRFLDEMWYIGKKTKGDVWFMADANFGIVKDDITIAKTLKEINKKYGSPKTFIYHTAKNNAKLVFQVANILGDSAPVNIAVQSFDPKVLDKIKRKNLNNKEISQFIKMHQAEGRTTTTDLLIPQSAETLESHLTSMRVGFELGFDVINTNILRMLPGTEMESDKSRKEFGFKTLWRPMDSGHGFYEGEFIFETDESIMETSTFSIEEMHYVKSIHFLTLLYWLHGVGKPLLKLALNIGINPIDIFIFLAKDQKSELSQKILKPLQQEYKEEWFESEEELIKHYSKKEVYEKLATGEVELKKLNLKYFANMIVEIDLLASSIDSIKKYIQENSKIDKELLETVSKLAFDTLKTDLTSPDLSKTIDYKVSKENFDCLKKFQIISKDEAYNDEDKSFSLNFYFPEEKFMLMTNKLKELNFEENPKNAIYTAVCIGIGKFLYNVNTNYAVKESSYNFDKNPFERLPEDQKEIAQIHP